MASSQTVPKFTPQEYLAMEREAEFRSEYIDGLMIAMAGGSDDHGRIATAALSLLWAQLRDSDCEARNSDNRLSIPAFNVYTYPDVWVSCGKPQHIDQHKDTTLNPRVVIEVLSPSTQNYDRGQKFRYYRSIPSLTDYLILAQDAMAAEHHHRHEDGSWILRDYTSPDDIVGLVSIGCRLRLRDLYDRVEFEG